MKNKKYLLLFLLLIPVIIIIGRSFALPSDGEIKTIEIQSENYNNAGSFHIDKTAEWYESGKVKLTLDIKSIEKNDTKKYKDIVLLIDASNAMNEGKLERAKSDAISLVNSLLQDLHHRVALIVFDSTATVKSNFTNNKEELTTLIRNISKNNKPNYNNALLRLNELLKTYDEDDRDLIALILTNGNTSLGTPNEVATYQMLKDKYKDIIINGIQYEDSVEILSGIKNITDNQFISKADEREARHNRSENNNRDSDEVIVDDNVLFDAIVNSKPYEKYMVVDTINNDYFSISSQDDITVSSGTIVLKEENGLQKVYWNLDGMLTGTTGKMEIIINIKPNYLLREGLYATNKETVITSKLPGEEEKRTTASNSPILSNRYTVNYELNKPADCSLEAISSENHFVYENVTKRNDTLYCNGYALKKWEIREIAGIKIINNDTFRMPNHDVTLYAVWTKVDLVKKMGGEVKETERDTLMVHDYNYENTFGKPIERGKFESITTLNHIRIPDNAIDAWDVSAEQSGTVMAWYTDEDEDEMYELYIGSPGGVLANPDSSYAFYEFYYVQTSDFKYFDVSKVENMEYMFGYYGYYADEVILDFHKWDTSNVTNLASVFYEVGYEADTVNIDTSTWNLASMTYLDGYSVFYHTFYSVGYEAKNVSIDSSGWKFPNLTDYHNYPFAYMYDYAGYYATTVNVKMNNIDFSRPINASYAFEELFWDVGYYATTVNIEVNNWKINVTNPYYYFAYFISYVGCYSQNLNIDMNNWYIKIADKDTEYMFYEFFYYTGEYSHNPNVKLKNWHFDITNCDNEYMFYEMLYNAFYYDTETYNFDLSGWEFNLKDTDASYMFYEMLYYGLYNGDSVVLNFSNWKLNIDNTDCSYMFEYMFYYTAYYVEEALVNLSGWEVNLSNDSYVDSMFYIILYETCYETPTFNLNFSNMTINSTIDDIDGMFEYAIYDSAYYSTTANIDLKNWKFPQVDNLTDVLKYMFYDSGENITTFRADLSNWDISKVNDLSGMLIYYIFNENGYYATTWNLVGLNTWDVSNVTDMSNLFYYAGYYATTWSIGDLSGWNTVNVTDMSNMFYYAGYKAETWNVGNLGGWDVSNVTNMSNMFYYAGYYATTWSIGDISNWNTSNVTNMHYMFGLTGANAIWSDIGTLKVYAEDIGSMFYDSASAKITLNIYNTPTDFDSIFSNAATNVGSGIVVNYTNDVTNIDDIVSRKSDNSNVTKGELLEE